MAGQRAMKRLLAILLIPLFAVLLAVPSFAEAPKGCEGPADLCQQISELNKKLATVKATAAKDVEKKVSAAEAESDKKKEERMAKVIASAAALAVALKFLLSFLEKWKGYFTGVKGRAWLKVVTLVVGLVAFVATNVGMGLPIWQSLILAGGGPGAILVHELQKLIPVLTGKKKDLPVSVPPPPSDEAPPTPVSGQPPAA